MKGCQQQHEIEKGFSVWGLGFLGLLGFLLLPGSVTIVLSHSDRRPRLLLWSQQQSQGKGRDTSVFQFEYLPAAG